MRGQCRSRQSACFCDILDALPGRCVLEHDPKSGKLSSQQHEMPVDENGLTIEDVDIGIGYLAMHQQRDPCFLGRFERWVDLAQIGDSRIAVRGDAGRIELDADDARIARSLHLARWSLICQVKRHQRLEIESRWHRIENPLTVGHGLRGRYYRCSKVRHDQRARKLPGTMRHDGSQRGTVPDVEMPIVGAQDSQLVDHADNFCIAQRTPRRTSAGGFWKGIPWLAANGLLGCRRSRRAGSLQRFSRHP